MAKGSYSNQFFMFVYFQFGHYSETTHKNDFRTDKKIEELPPSVKLSGGMRFHYL